MLMILGCRFKDKNSKTLPIFNLLLIDSTTIFNTTQIPEGNPIIFIYFSPDCENCQQETENLLSQLSDFKKTQFYFFTYDPMNRLRNFYYRYNFSKYSNITVGRDYNFSFPRYYQVNTTPYMAIYDRHKQLFAIFDGVPEVNKIVEIIKKMD